ncbi:MAG: 30S ribosomal protein S6 [Deltaproteobacteria bacterium]|nr:30S ribosomal protein S6 [Deltaproteobacteria bacterium]
MREYETVIVVRPEWSADQVRQLCERIAAVVVRFQGVVFHCREFARRRLAYRVQKAWRGAYIYADYGAVGDVVSEVERVLRYEEGVLKFLSVQIGAVESVEERKAKSLEEEARLVQLFGAGSEQGHSSGETDTEAGETHAAPTPTMTAGTI